MIAKCLCQECANPIEFEAEGAGQRINCPHCGKETVLSLPSKIPLPVPKTKAPLRPNVMHLETIRANSCYQTLRGVIDIAFWLSVAVLVVFAGLAWLSVLFSGQLAGHGEDATSGLGRVMQIGFAVSATVASCVAAILLVAVRQSALLLVDIADTLLYQHSR